MNSYLRNNSLFLSALTIIVVILTFAYDSMHDYQVRSFVRQGSVPLVHMVSRGFSAISFGYFSRTSTLLTENETLKKRVGELETLSTSYLALKESYTQLSKEAHLTTDPQSITAHILTTPSSSPYGTFFVDAGSNKGISRGAVVTSNDVVLGTVSEVHSHQSQVTLLFAPNATLDATVQGVSVALRGYGGANAHGEIPRVSTVHVGDIVTSARFAWKAVGTVSSFENSSAQSTAYIVVRPSVNLDTLQVVRIEIL